MKLTPPYYTVGRVLNTFFSEERNHLIVAMQTETRRDILVSRFFKARWEMWRISTSYSSPHQYRDALIFYTFNTLVWKICSTKHFSLHDNNRMISLSTELNNSQLECILPFTIRAIHILQYIAVCFLDEAIIRLLCVCVCVCVCPCHSAGIFMLFFTWSQVRCARFDR